MGEFSTPKKTNFVPKLCRYTKCNASSFLEHLLYYKTYVMFNTIASLLVRCLPLFFSLTFALAVHQSEFLLSFNYFSVSAVGQMFLMITICRKSGEGQHSSVPARTGRDAS